MDKLVEYVREELEKLLSGPGISWNKVGIMSAFDRAWIKGMARYAREKGIVLD